MLSLLFALVVAATAPDADTSTLTAIVADVAGRVDGVSVVTRADVAQLLAMDASQQQLGCTDESASCVAEVAAALGAEIIVRADLGVIDGAHALSLSVLNSADLTTTARALVRGRTIGALGDEVARVLPDLIRKVKAKTTTAASTRLFVTDVERSGGTLAVEVPPGATVDAGGTAWVLPVGVVGIVLGGIGLGAAGYGEWEVMRLENEIASTDDRLTPRAAKTALSDRDDKALVAKIGWIVGGSLVVIGGVLVGVGMIE